MAIEIETEKPDGIHNLKKDLRVGFDKVMVVPTVEKSQKEMKRL